MDTGRQILLQLILIALNAFFAAAEIAILSLNEGKLERAAKDGDKKAAKMVKMVAEPERFLSTIQIGITLAGFLGSAFAADNFSERLTDFFIGTFNLPQSSFNTVDTVSVVIITLILSFFTLVFGELVPKRIAMKKSEKLARAVSGVINALTAVFRPIVWLTSVSTNGVLRLLGMNPHDKEEAVSEDEIRLMIDIGEEKGTIEPAEKEMIDNIFEFNNSSAGEIMVHRTDMTVLWYDSTNEEILDTIMSSGYSRFPVAGESTDDIKGILLTRAYLLNQREKQPKPLSELLTAAYFIPESVRCDRLFRDMQSKNIHLAIVIDEFGGTAGLVTMEDLLEEIVGSIYDESDREIDPAIIKTGENSWRVPGTATIYDLEAATGISFDADGDGEPDFDTVGGLVFSCLTQIPEDGATPEVETHGLHIKVTSIRERRVEWANVTLLPPEPAEKEEKS